METVIKPGPGHLQTAWVHGETKVVVVCKNIAADFSADKRYEFGVITRDLVEAESRHDYADPYDALRDALIWVRCKHVLKEVLGGWHLVHGQVKIHPEGSRPEWNWYRVAKDATS